MGGFVDSTGGGGWGPVSTSTLMAIGREQPRRIVGTVNAAEFLVTFGATAGFIVGLWHDIVANLAAVIALLIGGAITAPIAAWLISRINPVLLGGLVGTAIVGLNISKVIGGAETYFGWAVPAAVTPIAVAVVVAAGVAATVRGALRTRRARAAELEAENAEEAAHADFHAPDYPERVAAAHRAHGSRKSGVTIVQDKAPKSPAADRA